MPLQELLHLADEQVRQARLGEEGVAPRVASVARLTGDGVTREHDDRDVPGPLVRLEPARGLPAVHDRQRQVHRLAQGVSEAHLPPERSQRAHLRKVFRPYGPTDFSPERQGFQLAPPPLDPGRSPDPTPHPLYGGSVREDGHRHRSLPRSIGRPQDKASERRSLAARSESGMGAETVEQDLRELEARLAMPASSETRESLAALLAADFREFGASGRIYDLSATLDALLAGARPTLKLEDFCAVAVALDTALVTYVSRSLPGPGWKPPALRSALWVRRSGRWQLLFHQGTRLVEG